MDVVRVISAMPGGRAEAVLREIASSEREKINSGGDSSGGARQEGVLRHPRIFASEWQRDTPGVEHRLGWVMDGGREIPLVLKIGVREGIFLEDVAHRNGSRGVSMRPVRESPPVLRIPSALSGAGIRSAACQIVAVWVIRGGPPSSEDRKRRRHGDGSAKRRRRQRYSERLLLHP